MSNLQQTLAEIEEMIPKLEWEILDEEQKDEFIAKIVERDLYMATTSDGHRLGPTFWAERVGATSSSIKNRVFRLDKPNAGDSTVARARRVRSELRRATPEQIAEALEEPEVRQRVHKAQDIAHKQTERRSKQNQREAIGESVSDDLDEQQRLVGRYLAAARSRSARNRRATSSGWDWREKLLRYLKGQITRAKRHFNRCADAAEKFPSKENDFQLEMSRRQLCDLQRAYDEMLTRGENEAA